LDTIIWTLSAGIPESLKFSIIGNYCYVKLLADSLLEHGLDEVLVFTGGEELEGLSPGWLPLQGSDLLKASRAYASLGTYVIYERRPPKWRVYKVACIKVFIEWPGMSSRNV
jgi:hypothetical protein